MADSATIEAARRELARRELARREAARQQQGGGVLRTIDDAVRGVADVATFGFADEIAAKLGSFTGIGGMAGDYEGNVAAERARDAEGGGARLAGQVIGALAVPGGAAKTTVGAALQGAGLGGLYGLGSGEGTLAERAPSAGTGALVGGAAGATVHKVADALLGRAAAKAVPSLDDLRSTSQAGYDAAEAAGVIIKPEGVQRLATGLVGDLADFGYHPALQPRVKAVVEEAERLAQGNVTFKGLDQFRRIAKNAAASTDPSEAAIGSRIVRRIEAYMENLPADDVLTGNAAQAASGVRQGRENWARMRRGEMVDTARLKAERRAASGGTGGNLDNTIRQNVRAILDNPKRSRGMTPAEIEAAEKVVRGTGTQNALRLTGRLSPTTGGLSAMLNVGATAANPLLAIPGVAGAVAKALADGMTVKNANALSEMIRTGGYTASQVGQRALQGVGPEELVQVAQAIKSGEARLSPAMAAIAAALMERATAHP